MSAETRLVSYIRWLEANGGALPELSGEARRLSLAALYGVDIFAIVVSALGVVLVALLHCARRFWRPRQQRRQQRENRNNSSRSSSPPPPPPPPAAIAKRRQTKIKRL